MIDDYREKIYRQYHSSYKISLYGNETLDQIKKQFGLWQRHYGRFLPNNKQAKIVDLGCGSGGLVFWLQARDYQAASGVDISEENIQLGSSLGISDLQRSDIVDFLRDKLGEFEVIFMRDVLGHFSKNEIIEILELCFKALKTGGRVIIKVPNAESPMTGQLRYGDFSHEVGFTGTSLAQVLAVAGFKQVRVFSLRPHVHGPLSLVRWCLWWPIEGALRCYRLVDAGTASGHFTQNIMAVAVKK